jgi:hypothetical protein
MRGRQERRGCPGLGRKVSEDEGCEGLGFLIYSCGVQNEPGR